MIDMRDAFFERLVEVAKEDDRIVFLTADHGAFALTEFEKKMPERYINVGISEQNMIGVAAGLAASGKIVFAYGISPFVSLRVLEQLTLDVAAMQLPVNIVSVGAGFTYSTDGPTHQGLQDLAAVLTIPKMTVLNSSDPENTRQFVDQAVLTGNPHYIRIEKEKLPVVGKACLGDKKDTTGFSVLRKATGNKTVLVGTGVLVHEVLRIANKLEAIDGVSVTVIDLYQIKPISDEFLTEASAYEMVITIEEGYVSGMGAQVLGEINKGQAAGCRVVNVGVEESYVYESGSRAFLQKMIGLEEKILGLVRDKK